jgi:hypothetical protein
MPSVESMRLRKAKGAGDRLGRSRASIHDLPRANWLPTRMPDGRVGSGIFTWTSRPRFHRPVSSASEIDGLVMFHGHNADRYVTQLAGTTRLDPKAQIAYRHRLLVRFGYSIRF